MSKHKFNANFLQWLQEMRDEHDSDSNKYMILNKAFNSLKKEKKEYLTPDSLTEVKFIGPKIMSDLKKRFKEAGGMADMSDIPSNSSSPSKRKRTSGVASASGPKKRGGPSQQPLFEPGTDDEDLPHPKRRSPPVSFREDHRNLQPEVPLGFSVPQYPFGVHSQMGQAHTIENSQSGYPPQAYHQASDNIPSHVSPVAPPLPAQSVPFQFSFIDEHGKQVLTCGKAIIDIEAGAMWYKICFVDGPEANAHPLRQRIRIHSYDNTKRKRREELIQAWIRDEDVEDFGLHGAAGYVFQSDIDIDRFSGTNGMGSQTAAHTQGDDLRRTAVKPNACETSKASGGSSLADLLGAENKKKRHTIDPSRVINSGKDWNVRNGGLAHASSDGVVKKETTQSQQSSVSSQDIKRQRMAAAALARQKAVEPTSSSQSQQPSTSMANPAPRRANTLPEYSRDSNTSQSIPYAPPRDFCLPVPSNPPGSVAIASVRHLAQQLPDGMRRTVTAPNILPPSGPAVSKSKPKGKARGRVSEFAPNPRAVDELDNDLDRQASQKMRPEQFASTSASSASADLIDDVTDLTIANAQSFPEFNPVIFPRGSFEVILVLDTREVKSQDNRSHIVNELEKRGVKVLQRSLALGDVLWIAQRRIPSASEENECVLDYILERKRMDDLCLSIKDGRFREQKFRLANTGLKVFYLIEEYDSLKNREAFGIQIDTARSSTQIVDGFIVKETKKLSYTIDFLATMHRTLVQEYQGEPLYMIPSHIIRRHSYMALQKYLHDKHPTMRYLTSYACFESLNNKSKNLTAKDLFTQMLLCVKGLSPEKAAAIIGTYPTLRDLWNAFRIAEIDEEEGKQLVQEEAAVAPEQGKKGKGRKKRKVPQAQEMLCNLEAGGRQRIGPALSASIYRLMRANSYEE